VRWIEDTIYSDQPTGVPNVCRNPYVGWSITGLEELLVPIVAMLTKMTI